LLRIIEADNVLLTKEILEDEVKVEVWDCDGSKSLGPDGYNLNFIKYSCVVIKNDIVKAVSSFHSYGLWPKGTNGSFLTLIPKVYDCLKDLK